MSDILPEIWLPRIIVYHLGMKNLCYYSFLIFLLGLIPQMVISQNQEFFEASFTESTTDQQKFRMYLDSVDKYLYRDIDIAMDAIKACEQMLASNIAIPDSLSFLYVLQKIFICHSKATPLEAYKIIMAHEKSIDSLAIPYDYVSNFKYLKSFTYMSIGDLEAAQESYYDNIETATAKGDIKTVISCYYSLGQLFNDEKDGESALRCFEKVLECGEKFEIRNSTLVLLYSEMSEAYLILEQPEEALVCLEKAKSISSEAELKILYAETLLNIGAVHLEKDEIQEAKDILQQLEKLDEGGKDTFIVYRINRFKGDIYHAEKNYSAALTAYKDLIATCDTTDQRKLMSLYQKAQEICRDNKDFEAGYHYLIAHDEVKSKFDNDAKKQKTRYLQIKFESEEKEKENEILNARILQNKAESKLLYSWLVVSLLVVLILFGAFYNKGRYSKRLEQEVLKRTINLKKSNELLDHSNKELTEFNRILFHDLKEPLRSVVGFSQLANRKAGDNNEVKQYLNYVIESGEQLEHLIESISLYQQVNSLDLENPEEVNIKIMIDQILLGLEEKYPDKTVSVEENCNSKLIIARQIIRPVFEILIDNAIKYNENKFVYININYSCKDQQHLFTIKDNGIGIAKEYHDKVFEMFKRLNDRKDFKGAGLGLSTAKKMIQRIDGHLSILQSDEDQGSTFLLAFPILTEVASPKTSLV